MLLRLATAAIVIALGAPRLGAQTAGPPPAPPAPPSPPPAGPKLVVPASAMVPADSAVALCNNGTWIYAPGAPTDCAQRGGLRVAMPPRPTPPAVATARAALVAAPAATPTAPPAGATGQCKDGTFLFGTPTADSCTGKGGVAATFSRPAPPPPRPPRP